MPDNETSNILLSVETETFDDSRHTDPDIGASNQMRMTLFKQKKQRKQLPTHSRLSIKEVQAIQQHLCQQPDHITWPTVGREPMNEYITLFLVTLAFPTMFPDACVDLPTQLCYEMYNSQKESNTSSSLEKKKVPSGIIALPHTQDLPTGHLIHLKESVSFNKQGYF